jgi:SnoaL-like domain
VERQHGPVAGLPDQDWPLRVTLVFRREDSGWRLVHRHADALVHPISMDQLSLLARGVEPSQDSVGARMRSGRGSASALRSSGAA